MQDVVSVPLARGLPWAALPTVSAQNKVLAIMVQEKFAAQAYRRTGCVSDSRRFFRVFLEKASVLPQLDASGELPLHCIFLKIEQFLLKGRTVHVRSSC